MLTHEIRFASGHSVFAVTSNPAAFRGRGGSVCIDEAAHHPNLPELLKAASAGDWGGDLSVISTHNGATNPFNELCEQLRTKERHGSLHRVTLDDALAEGLFQKQCERRGEPWSPEIQQIWRDEKMATWGSDEEYRVIPSSSGGVYIRRDLIEACTELVPSARLELPPDHHVRLNEAERESFIAAWINSSVRPLLGLLPGDRLTTVPCWSSARTWSSAAPGGSSCAACPTTSSGRSCGPSSRASRGSAAGSSTAAATGAGSAKRR